MIGESTPGGRSSLPLPFLLAEVVIVVIVMISSGLSGFISISIVVIIRSHLGSSPEALLEDLRSFGAA